MSRPVPIFENRVLTPDVADDVSYFDDHPDEGSYQRLATQQECETYSLPPGTRCLVVKVSPTRHVRMFQTPDARRN